jgi:hypothetical protein
MTIITTVAFAAPITYNITFTTTSGPVPTSGSFSYDSTAPLATRFSNFTVLWGGGIFDLTAAANTGEQFLGTDCGTTPSSQSVFMFLSGQNVCANPAVIAWDGIRSTGIQTFDFRDQESSGSGAPMAGIDTVSSSVFSPGADATGTFSIESPSTVPEPSTLILTSLPGVLLLRRRFNRPNKTRG